MKIQDIYSDPTDSIPTLATEDHFYESLEDLQKSHGSLHNLLGSANQKPPLAPTPALLKKRQPLAERSNLPPIKKECCQKVSEKEPNLSSDSKKKVFLNDGVKKDANVRSRKDVFLFWKASNRSSNTKSDKSKINFRHLICLKWRI